MKKLYVLVAAATISASAFAQTTIYSENFGVPASTTSVSSYTGYQNASPVVYSGSSDVRSSSPSSGYAGASGDGNVFFTATKGTNLVISGINTTGYKNIQLSFGELKTVSANSNELTVEVSQDGATWSPLSYTRPSGSGTNNFILVSPSGNIPATSSLSLRFTNTSTGQWRVDDVKLVGTPQVLGTAEAAASKKSLLKNTSVQNTLEFAAKSEVKIINMNGQAVKSASVESGSSLDVSGLAKGMYIVTGTVNGEKVSQKIIKK